MSHPESSSRSRAALLAAALLLAANVVVPLVWGDVYPFTSAPMFRDAPVRCCQYRVLVNGVEQPPAEWLLQRIYDGNPVGYGVGIAPPEILEREYGIVHDESAVRRHVHRQLTMPQRGQIQNVEIIQDVLGAMGPSVGVIETHRWTIQRTN